MKPIFTCSVTLGQSVGPDLMSALNELVNNEMKYCGVLEVLNDLYLHVSLHKVMHVLLGLMLGLGLALKLWIRSGCQFSR